MEQVLLSESAHSQESCIEVVQDKLLRCMSTALIDVSVENYEGRGTSTDNQLDREDKLKNFETQVKNVAWTIMVTEYALAAVVCTLSYIDCDISAHVIVAMFLIGCTTLQVQLAWLIHAAHRYFEISDPEKMAVWSTNVIHILCLPAQKLK